MPLAAQSATSATSATQKPNLVVVLVVDQMRPDYFTRWGAQLTGGFARIHRDAAFFPAGMQDHAMTETAPGHSTILSGREPVHTGIVSNGRGIQFPAFPSLEGGAKDGAAPYRFQGTTLADWLMTADPDTRVLSVSRKSRAAILTVGRQKANVFWYGVTGFTTSRWYADSLPTWLTAFNARTKAAELARGEWRLLLPDSAYAERDSVLYEHGGTDIAFPHTWATSDKKASRLEALPVMDSLTLAVALDGARHLRLGRGESTDLLVVALSTTDAVGHAYGHESREMHDHILRLDRWVGAFLDSLNRVVPAARTIVALTADHGMNTTPESRRAAGDSLAGRVAMKRVTASLDAEISRRTHVNAGLEFEGGLLYADTVQLSSAGVNVDSVARAVAMQLESVAGIAHVYTARSLAAATDEDTDARRWRHSIPPVTQWLVAVVAKPDYALSDGDGAEHGTMHEESVTVPIALMGAPFKAGVYPTRARTVDIAPTLGSVLGLVLPTDLDGRVLEEALVNRQPHTAMRN